MIDVDDIVGRLQVREKRPVGGQSLSGPGTNAGAAEKFQRRPGVEGLDRPAPSPRRGARLTTTTAPAGRSSHVFEHRGAKPAFVEQVAEAAALIAGQDGGLARGPRVFEIGEQNREAARRTSSPGRNRPPRAAWRHDRNLAGARRGRGEARRWPAHRSDLRRRTRGCRSPRAVRPAEIWR